MDDFLEIDEKKKTINLDDFSIADLEQYILELNQEVLRVKEEINKKNKLMSEAQKLFK